MCLSETFPFLCFLLEIIALQHFRVISFLSLSSLNVCLNKRKELVETAIYWTKNLYCIIFQSSVLNGGKSHLVSLHSSFLGSIKETTEVKNCLLSYVYSFKLWFMQPSRKKIKTKKKSFLMTSFWGQWVIRTKFLSNHTKLVYILREG